MVAQICVAPQVAAARIYPMQMITNMSNAMLDHDWGEMLEYRQLIKHPKFRPDWNTSSANKFGQLEQGIDNRIKSPMNIIFFINKAEVPDDRF